MEYEKLTEEELFGAWYAYLEDRYLDDEFMEILRIELFDLLHYNEQLYENFIYNADVALEALERAQRERFDRVLPVVIDGEFPQHLERTVFSHDENRFKLSEEDRGTMIVFEGQLISTLKEKKTRYRRVGFVCSDCGAITYVEQNNMLDDKIIQPEYCAGCGKPRGKVKFTISPHASEMEDYIQFTLQEVADENFAEMRCVIRDSRRINLFHLTIGELYKVVGILRYKHDSVRKNSGFYYLDVLGMQRVGEEKIDLKEEDVKKIEELSRNPDIIEILKSHIAPDIHGRDDVKEILLLQLVGGVDTYNRNIHRPESGEIHVLLVGDPATAKTVLMKSVAALAPKAVLAMGTTSTKVGLTVSVVKDPFTGTMAYSAGIFPRANGGLAIVDEVDKFIKAEKDYAFLEALEGAEVSRATAAGMVRLRTKIAFLGGANPKYGKWEDGYSLAEQVDLTPQMFSRLDFIYILRDVSNEVLDREVARTILMQGAERPRMNSDLFKKYIAYARTLKPEMSTEAAQILADYFVELRKRDENITYRQARTLRKVAAAFAKLRLSERITVEDAKRTVDLYERYLQSWNYDSAQFTEGFGSKELKIKRETLLFLAQSGGQAAVEEVLAEVSWRTGYSEDDIYSVLDTLARDGVLKKQYPLLMLQGGGGEW